MDIKTLYSILSEYIRKLNLNKSEKFNVAKHGVAKNKHALLIV